MLKPVIKQGLRAAAWAAGPHRWRRGPCLLVLTYHRVLPADHPDRAFEQPGMLVTPGLLARHFRTLRQWFTPVHLDDWLQAARAGTPPPGRSVAITFDDGWQDNYHQAFPVIQAERMPVTLFLVTDLVGTRQRFWPNRLGSLLTRWPADAGQRLPPALCARLAGLGMALDRPAAGWTPATIDPVINRAKVQHDDAQLHALLDQVEQYLPAAPGEAAEPDLLNWEQVRDMAASGLVRFGSHTRSHARLLPSLPPDRLLEEIRGSRQVIEQALGRPCPLFCYPNGDCSPAADALVRREYRGALATEAGWHRPGQDPLWLKRMGVHEGATRTPAALLARVSGWPGV